MPAIRGSCLCGTVAWEVTEELHQMHHCHCSRCRKAHGSAFATYVGCRPEAFRLLRGREHITRYKSSPAAFRPFCDRCGSVVPDGEPWQGRVGIPAGPFDDDPGVRPLAHIFTGSKAPWFTIADDLPSFEAYPPGIDAQVLPDLSPRDPETGARRGSCLCGRVSFVFEGTPLRCWNCHCSRCRKARAAAHASNLFVPLDGLRFTPGEDDLISYKVPEARYYTQVFCRTCGSPMPRRDSERGFAVIPLGSLDDDPGVRPQRHIFAASKAPWYEISDSLPQDADYPTA
jgi:hypothetical protein